MTARDKPRAKHKSGRRGVVPAAVVACLFLTVLLSAALAGSALHRHRQLERHARDLQAVWLAESAAHRAAARLRLDPDYAGETWTISAEALGGGRAGKAVIAVAADKANRRRVTIEAFYPDDPLDRTRVEKTITIDVAAP